MINALAATVNLQAFPGCGPSVTATPGGAGLDSFPSWHIPIPYNLIIPQRSTVKIGLSGAVAGDTIVTPVLCLEYSAAAKTKPGAPPSSKNNP
jgi:hypothetical protein